MSLDSPSVLLGKYHGVGPPASTPDAPRNPSREVEWTMEGLHGNLVVRLSFGLWVRTIVETPAVRPTFSSRGRNMDLLPHHILALHVPRRANPVIRLSPVSLGGVAVKSPESETWWYFGLLEQSRRPHFQTREDIRQIAMSRESFFVAHLNRVLMEAAPRDF
jgi:hypothetical protein